MKILIFAPHNDDEVLGAGGTLSRFADQGNDVFVCEVTSGENKVIVDKIKSEALKAHAIIGVKQTFFLDLPVVAINQVPVSEINEKMLEIVKIVDPEIAFIPHKGDIHTDHVEVAKSAMVALRPVSAPNLKAIYAYETLSETEWNIPSVENVFIPNVWSDISNYLDIKLQAMNCYQTQIKEFPHPRSLEAIEALAKYRGSNICVKYAESFMLIRSLL
jgi:LmbE family N-acetylglucosaminyl deacetylase